MLSLIDKIKTLCLDKLIADGVYFILSRFEFLTQLSSFFGVLRSGEGFSVRPLERFQFLLELRTKAQFRKLGD